MALSAGEQRTPRATPSLGLCWLHRDFDVDRGARSDVDVALDETLLSLACLSVVVCQGKPLCASPAQAVCIGQNALVPMAAHISPAFARRAGGKVCNTVRHELFALTSTVE